MTLQIVRPNFPPLESFSAKFSHALKTGRVTNNGEWVQEFERVLTKYLGVPTICFSSGQAALMAMLAAVNVEGGEVITPSLTFCATPHAVTWAGARPVFADIDQDTLCIDPHDVERKINNNTRAILGVDAYGICCDYDALEELGRHYNVPVIYDSAAAFGSVYQGVVTGRFGDAQIFSFHATKSFSCMEGGCLSSNNSVLLDAARRIRNFGQEDDGDCKITGFNGKMMEVCALIGIEAMKSWSVDSVSRKNAAMRLQAALRWTVTLAEGKKQIAQNPIWLYMPIRIQDWKCSRDEVIEGLKRHDIIARKYYLPAHLMTAYRAAKVELPVTEKVASEVISLPVYSDMSQSEINTIASALQNIKNGEG